jgi:tRNA(fMet)-specific endonuclease VapC
VTGDSVRISGKAKRNREALEAFVKHVPVLDRTEATADHHAEIRSHLRKKGGAGARREMVVVAAWRGLEAG